jgi:hypothetical protein
MMVCSPFVRTLVVVSLICCSSTLLAQDRRPPIGGFGFGAGALDILRRADVREELEIVEDQIKDLETIGEEMRTRARELFGGLRDLDPEQRREKLRESFRQIAEEAENKVSKVLLPHQMKRMKQLTYQMRFRGGTGRALTDGDLAEELEISEEQREALRKKAEEVEAELRQKVNQLRKEAQDKLLSVLSAEQRKKFEEMIGEPFEFQRTEGPAGGGFGGQGGFFQRRRGEGGDGREGRNEDRNRRSTTE